MGFDSKAKDRSLEATWIERSGSAAEAAKPRPRRRGALTKRVLRNARDRVEEEEDEVVGMKICYLSWQRSWTWRRSCLSYVVDLSYWQTQQAD